MPFLLYQWGGWERGGFPPLYPPPLLASVGPQPGATAPCDLGCKCDVGHCLGISKGRPCHIRTDTYPLISTRCVNARAMIYFEPPSVERKKRVFMGWILGWVYWDPHARPEVALMLPLDHATKAPQDQVMVCFVSRVPEGCILEQTAVRPKDVVQGQCQDFGIAVGIAIAVIVERRGGPLEGPV